MTTVPTDATGPQQQDIPARRAQRHGSDATTSAASAGRLDRTFTHRLHTLSKLTDRVSQTAYLAGTGLPLGEGRCLSAVGAFAPLSVGDLAARANLNKGQASRAAQSLVDQGLVVKTASAADARGVELTLTRKGRAVWQRVMAVIDRRNEEIFGCLAPAEQQQLSDMLDRLVAHARRSAAGDGADDPAAD